MVEAAAMHMGGCLLARGVVIKGGGMVLRRAFKIKKRRGVA